MPIIPLTHVCRYWRESIVSTPEFWTSISGKRKGLAALSLERTEAAPLNVSLWMHQIRKDPWFADLIAPHTYNIAILGVECVGGLQELAQALPDFPQSMPNLQSLTLMRHPTRSWQLLQDGHIDSLGPLPPTLKYLRLSDIPLCPSSLRLRSLTRLDLSDCQFKLHLDTLLEFLEENSSLEWVILGISFADPSLWSFRRRGIIKNRLQFLFIDWRCGTSAQLLISSIPLQRGAHLRIINSATSESRDPPKLKDILSQHPMAHLSNLTPFTSMDCLSDPRSIRLSGPNGEFSYDEINFVKRMNKFHELSLLPLNEVRQFRFRYRDFSLENHHTPAFRPSLFPALEILAVNIRTPLSRFFSTMFSDPSSSPSLKILALSNCKFTEDFMKELARYAFERKNTTSARLIRVLIVDPDGNFPSAASIDTLRKHVPVVDTRIADRVPPDLADEKV